MIDEKLIIAMAALALGVFNFIRLGNLDDKNEYKDKRKLYQECLNEAKEIIEKNITESEALFRRRVDFDLLDSKYIGSDGYNSAYSELSNNFRELERLKKEVIDIYKELSSITEISDKEAFDACINIQTNLKNSYLENIKNIAEAKSLVEQIENLALHANNNALKGSKN